MRLPENIIQKYKRPLPAVPQKMELVGDGENQKFICACGYREKLSAFEKRKKESGKSVSKKDVSKYMHKMKQEAKEPVNPAFASALAKIKNELPSH